MPGGRLNEGEDVILGLKREVLEEIGVDIEVEKILATGTFTNLSGVRTYFVVFQSSLVGSVEPYPLDEVGKIGWFTPEEFFALPVIYPEYQEALKSVLKNVT